MSRNLDTMTLRLQQDVPVAEASLDSALIAVSTLMTSVVTARQRVGVAPKTGQASILRVKRRSKGTPDRRRRGTPFEDMLRVC